MGEYDEFQTPAWKGDLPSKRETDNRERKTERGATSALCSTDWLEWLRGKLADAERALAAREQEAAVWKSGTNKSWAESAKLHPSTAKLPPLTKAVRMENARRAERITVKCRRDVEGFKTIIEALSHSNGGLSDGGTAI